jgi:hypothetical protein
LHAPAHFVRLNTDQGTVLWKVVKNALDEAADEAVKLISQWQKVSTDQEASALDDYSGNRNEVLR